MNTKLGLMLGAGLLAVAGAAGGGYYYLRRSDPMQRATQLIAAGNLRAAQVELRNAIRAKPRDAEAHLQMARLQMKLADPVAAEIEFRAARAVGADQWVIAPLLGEVLLAQGLNKETLEQVPPRGPTPQLAMRNLLMRSIAQLSLKDTKAAAETLALAQKTAPGSVEASLMGARLAASANDLPAVKAKLAEVLQRDPTDVEGLLMQEQLVTAQGDHAEGLSLADRAVKSAPWSAMARMRRANQLMFAGQDDKAQEDVSAVLEVQPRFIEAVYLRALLLARKGKFQEATVEMEKLSSAAQRLPQALYYQAMLAANLGHQETAIDFARRYNNLVPSDPDGVKLLARAELSGKRPERVVALLDRRAGVGQSDAETLDLLGSAYAMMGNGPKATAMFQEAVALAPNDASILAHYGITQVQTGAAAAGAVTLERSLVLAPGANPTAGEAMVSAAMELGELDRAEAALATLKGQVGETEGVGILTGLLRQRRGDAEGARASYVATLKKFPGSIMAKLDLAKVLVQQGQRTEAVAAIGEILAKEPGNQAAVSTYVELLMRENQLPAALQALEAAHAAKPRDVAFTVMLSDVQTLMKTPERAIVLVNASKDFGPLSPPLLAALARAQVAAGKLDDAKASYRQVLAIEPRNLVVRNDLVLLLLRNKEPDAAKAVLHDGLAASPGDYRVMLNWAAVEANTSGVDAALKLAGELRQDPANLPTVTLLKGDILMRTGRYAEAAAAFAAEYKALPEGPLLMRLVQAEVMAGQSDDATRNLREWLAKTPDTPDVAQALAQLDIGAKRYEDAVTHLSLVLARRPNDALALNNLAWVYAETGDKRARAAAQKAYLQSPNSDAADTLGWILVRDGDTKAGLPLLQRSSVQRPDDPAVQYHLAVALKNDGQRDAAAKVLGPLLAGNTAFEDKVAAQSLLQEVSAK